MNTISRLLIVSFMLLATPFFGAEAPEEAYQFVGRHLVVSYYGCNHEALTNVQKVSEKMHEAVKASGAQLLDASEYVFQPDGLTMVLLLSESHASIHTYPEHDACFIDLFTCGHRCSAEKFDAVLREYLRPKEVDCKILKRG